MPNADVIVQATQSNFFLFHLLTEAAESFLDHVGDDVLTYGNAIAVDQRQAQYIVHVMREEFGLVVR